MRSFSALFVAAFLLFPLSALAAPSNFTSNVPANVVSSSGETYNWSYTESGGACGGLADHAYVIVLSPSPQLQPPSDNNNFIFVQDAGAGAGAKSGTVSAAALLHNDKWAQVPAFFWLSYFNGATACGGTLLTARSNTFSVNNGGFMYAGTAFNAVQALGDIVGQNFDGLAIVGGLLVGVPLVFYVIEKMVAMFRADNERDKEIKELTAESKRLTRKRRDFQP